MRVVDFFMKERRSKGGIVNVYSYIEDSSLRILRFDKMTDE